MSRFHVTVWLVTLPVDLIANIYFDLRFLKGTCIFSYQPNLKSKPIQLKEKIFLCSCEGTRFGFLPNLLLNYAFPLFSTALTTIKRLSLTICAA